MRLQAFNPSTDELEKTYLSTAIAAGVTSFTVKNSNNITTSDRILLGGMGREKSEIVTPSAVSSDGVTITLGTGTKFPHSGDDPVFVLRYDQIKFYRSTTGINGSYTVQATLAIDVDNYDQLTYYDDATGLTSYYYYVTFYHSLRAIESAGSDPMPGGSYDSTTVGALVDEFLTDINDVEQKKITIPQILSLLNECSDDLLTQSRKPYRFLRKSWSLSTTANTPRISLATLSPAIWKLDYTKYRYVFGGTDRTDEIQTYTNAEMDYTNSDNTALGDDYLQRLSVDLTSNEFVLRPMPLTSRSNVITVYGWKKFTRFTGVGSTFETPSYRVYKLFLLSRYWLRRAEDDAKFLPISDRYASMYSTEVVKLQRANKFDLGNPSGMRPDTHNPRGLRR